MRTALDPLKACAKGTAGGGGMVYASASLAMDSIVGDTIASEALVRPLATNTRILGSWAAVAVRLQAMEKEKPVSIRLKTAMLSTLVAATMNLNTLSGTGMMRL